MFDFINLETMTAVVMLTAMEVVLGIDNIIFVSILVGRVPATDRDWVRRVGLGLAMVARIVLLLALRWVMGLTTPLFSAFGREISGRGLILLGGGLFLIAKSTWEIHEKLEGGPEGPGSPAPMAVGAILIQIALLDVVFSLDSVITAVGMTKDLWVMVTAIVIAVGVMMVFAKSVGDFVEQHPTMKILALSFLNLIGVLLLAEGLGVHLNRGYVYFAMAFSFIVELINMRVRGPLPMRPLHSSGHGPE